MADAIQCRRARVLRTKTTSYLQSEMREETVHRFRDVEWTDQQERIGVRGVQIRYLYQAQLAGARESSSELTDDNSSNPVVHWSISESEIEPDYCGPIGDGSEECNGNRNIIKKGLRHKILKYPEKGQKTRKKVK